MLCSSEGVGVHASSVPQEMGQGGFTTKNRAWAMSQDQAHPNTPAQGMRHGSHSPEASGKASGSAGEACRDTSAFSGGVGGNPLLKSVQIWQKFSPFSTLGRVRASSINRALVCIFQALIFISTVMGVNYSILWKNMSGYRCIYTCNKSFSPPCVTLTFQWPRVSGVTFPDAIVVFGFNIRACVTEKKK